LIAKPPRIRIPAKSGQPNICGDRRRHFGVFGSKKTKNGHLGRISSPAIVVDDFHAKPCFRPAKPWRVSGEKRTVGLAKFRGFPFPKFDPPKRCVGKDSTRYPTASPKQSKAKEGKPIFGPIQGPGRTTIKIWRHSVAFQVSCVFPLTFAPHFICGLIGQQTWWSHRKS